MSDDDEVWMHEDVPPAWPTTGDTVPVIYQDDGGNWHSKEVTFTDDAE